VTAEWAYGAALAGLPWMTPQRLRRLLDGRAARDAWADMRWGRAGEAWAAAAGKVAVGAVEEAHLAAGITVSLLGQPGYPEMLAGDHEAPAVLFSRGGLSALRPPSVGVVGTRRATHAGRETAAELGRELAAAGVGVVSGLALGIDGAAHLGALGAGAAPPVGVVACGLDVVYPRRHRALWEQVAEAGALLSEVPLGTPPEPWRFPLRNRVIAALSQVVVVVESHETGGSMHTVNAAEARSRTVLAVPGSVRSPAAAGVNRLLAEGCGPARDTLDVLVALGLCQPGARSSPPVEPALPEEEREVLEAVDWGPTSVDTVLSRTGAELPAVAAVLARLEHAGWVRCGGGWWERTRNEG
jgi:DNA processing protein